MKSNYLLIAVVGILGCATGAAVREFVTPARAQAPLVYQYKVLEGGGIELTEAVMNSLGQYGWRVVTVTPNHGVVFERAFAMPPPAQTPLPVSRPAPAPAPTKP
jgi:hypothetical protein